MFIGKSYAAVLLGTLIAAPVFAADTVTVGNAWARATAPGQNAAGAYMELVSPADAALIGVETPVAARAELHVMSMDGGVMRMRAVEKIDLPARKAVKLAPGGFHVMLIDIKQPLKAGDKVPLTLTIRGAGAALTTIRVEAEVRSVGAAAMHGPGH
ncbi:MAG: copper chaperone PCu(A)C [Burkholderiales bacterium]|nr:copper chaperone PCu(A)C [Burkholderiales bacterium]